MTDTTQKPEALTETEVEDFNALLSAATTDVLREMPEGVRVALFRVTFDGQPRAVVCVVDESERDNVDIRPMALMMTDDLFARMEHPA